MNDLHLMPHQEDALNRTEQFNRCAYYLDMGPVSYTHLTAVGDGHAQLIEHAVCQLRHICSGLVCERPPVSYTHLDVYKRQQESCGVEIQ